MAHTPGPWAINKINPWTINYLQFEEPLDDRNVVCRMPDKNPETEANARIIAQAPELLAALNSLIKKISDRPDNDYEDYEAYSEIENAIKCGEEAIAKATGEQS